MSTPDPSPSAWYATPDHPNGEHELPHFEVVGAFVYPSDGHPDGPSSRPWYQLRGHSVFAVDGHPDGPSIEPSFRVVDCEVRPHPGDAEAAWFRIVRPSGTGPPLM